MFVEVKIHWHVCRGLVWNYMNTICWNVVYFNLNFNLLIKQSIQYKDTLRRCTVHNIIPTINLFCSLVTELYAVPFLLDKVLDLFLTYFFVTVWWQNVRADCQGSQIPCSPSPLPPLCSCLLIGQLKQKTSSCGEKCQKNLSKISQELRRVQTEHAQQCYWRQYFYGFFAMLVPSFVYLLFVQMQIHVWKSSLKCQVVRTCLK